MKPDEARQIIDQYFIDGDESYECLIETNVSYSGDEKELLCSISSYTVQIQPDEQPNWDSISFTFYAHPKEHTDECPKISREALVFEGEFFLILETQHISSEMDVELMAKNKLDMWLEGKDTDNDDGKYLKPSEKTKNFLLALVRYYCGVMKKKIEQEK